MTKDVAMVWGSQPPAFSIGHERPLWPGDSGFTVLFDDAPDPDEVQGPDDPRISLVHLDCLLDEHPELGRGLDIARESRGFKHAGSGGTCATTTVPPRFGVCACAPPAPETARSETAIAAASAIGRITRSQGESSASDTQWSTEARRPTTPALWMGARTMRKL